MTVAALTSSIEYVENGVTLAFVAPFRFVAGGLSVTRVLASGSVVALVEGTNYSVTGGATDAGGTVTLVTTIAGSRLRIRRATPRTQLADYATGDTFPAETHEGALDRSMLIDQEQDALIRDTASRAVMVPDGETIGRLPALAQRIGKFFGFAADGSIAMLSGTGNDAAFRTDAAQSTGSSLIGFIASGVGAIVRSVLDKLRGFVEVTDFGATPNSGNDDTLAFTRALTASKKVRIPPGRFVVDTIDLPGVNGLELLGSGRGQTILEAKNANKPILRKEQVAGVVQFARIGRFALKAHAAGSAGTAFDCSGFRACRFVEISGLSNGSAGFQSLFDVASYPYLTYGCIWENCSLAEQTGWSYAWNFNNRGFGPPYNANSNNIINPWIYANAGMSIAIDALKSALTVVRGGLIEANTGAVGVRMGQSTLVDGLFLELNAEDIRFSALAEGTSNGGTVRNCYISNAHTIDLTGCSANLWEGNAEAGLQTFTGNNGTNVVRRRLGVLPSAPTIARTALGTFSAGPTLIAAAQVTGLDQANRITFHLRYSATPTAANACELTLTPPAGWIVEAAVVSATRGANGIPSLSGVQANSGGTVWNIAFAAADAHEIDARVTMAPAP